MESGKSTNRQAFGAWPPWLTALLPSAFGGDPMTIDHRPDGRAGTVARALAAVGARFRNPRSGPHAVTDAAAIDSIRTLQELRGALAADQLVLHYQPKIDLRTGAVAEVEALVRWSHPRRGLLLPGSFLELVEDSGLMREMTGLVLAKALDQAETWQAGGKPLTIAVNLPASSVADSGLPERVIAMLEARGLPASALILEVTEEFLVTDRDRAESILTRLRAAGIRIAVDDFDMDRSPLGSLRGLPIDEVKLDSSLVSPMAGDSRVSALVASTIKFAHSIGLRLVAEGVENAVAHAQLARYGCDHAQGYHLSRPMPALDLDVWLATRHPDADVG